MATAEVTTIINTLRAKMAQGIEVTIEEQVEAVRLLRADRLSAVTAGAVKKKVAVAKVAVKSPKGDDLLDELMGDL